MAVGVALEVDVGGAETGRGVLRQVGGRVAEEDGLGAVDDSDVLNTIARLEVEFLQLRRPHDNSTG